MITLHHDTVVYLACNFGEWSLESTMNPDPLNSGPDPGRCSIGQKKIDDACIGQIFKANNEKHRFLRTHKDLDA